MNAPVQIITSKFGLQYSTRQLPARDLHAAQRDYCAAHPEAHAAEHENDLMDFTVMASVINGAVRVAWQKYRKTNDHSDRREVTSSDIAEQVADVLAEAFGMSRSAAVLLTEAVKAEAVS